MSPSSTSKEREHRSELEHTLDLPKQLSVYDVGSVHLWNPRICNCPTPISGPRQPSDANPRMDHLSKSAPSIERNTGELACAGTSRHVCAPGTAAHLSKSPRWRRPSRWWLTLQSPPTNGMCAGQTWWPASSLQAWSSLKPSARMATRRAILRERPASAHRSSGGATESVMSEPFCPCNSIPMQARSAGAGVTTSVPLSS